MDLTDCAPESVGRVRDGDHMDMVGHQAIGEQAQGRALAGLAQELAEARREIALLRRENTALRATVARGNAP